MAPAETATPFELVPAETLVTVSGEGQAFPVPAEGPRVFLLQMEISDIIDQESLALSVWGSADGQEWGTMPLLKFPQRFYRGASKMALDLSARPEIRHIRARWELNRWGRGVPEPRFRFGVTAQPLSSTAE
jgi:hypothetical protein